MGVQYMWMLPLYDVIAQCKYELLLQKYYDYEEY